MSDEHSVIPSPDPSVITAAVIKELKNDLRYEMSEKIDAVIKQFIVRFEAMDKASVVHADNMNRFPTLLDREVNGLRTAAELRLDALQKLVNTQLDGVQTQFKERDVRGAASDDASKLAIKDALQAQKESAASTQENNKAAIDKSEAGFKDQIRALDTQLNSAKETLGGQFIDAKDRISRLETMMIAARDTKGDSRDAREDNRSSVMVGVAVAGLLFSIVAGFVGFNFGHNPSASAALSAENRYVAPPGYVLTPLSPVVPK